jgi:hypothetical protein
LISNHTLFLVLGMPGLRGPHSRRPTPVGSGPGPRPGAAPIQPVWQLWSATNKPVAEVPEGDPRSRTNLETRLAEVKVEQHAQLRSNATGIDPVLVKEVVEELQREEREIRERLRQLDGPTDAMRALSAIRGLRGHSDDLRTALRHGDPNGQRKIFTRTIRSVT